jgi:hypothetical protein
LGSAQEWESALEQASAWLAGVVPGGGVTVWLGEGAGAGVARFVPQARLAAASTVSKPAKKADLTACCQLFMFSSPGYE